MKLFYGYESGANPAGMFSGVALVENGKYSSCKIDGTGGYTLVEAMISLIILLVFSIALFGRFRYDSSLSDSRRKYVAMRLIDREATLLHTFPHSMMPIKRHTINNDEWTVRTSRTDAGVTCYTVTAEVSGVVAARAMFYARKPDEKQ